MLLININWAKMDKLRKEVSDMEKRNYEYREIPITADEDKKYIISGHAAVYNQPTDICGYYTEVIERGAFDKTDLSDVVLTQNHNVDTEIPLARYTQGRADNTLQLSLDDAGLAMSATLDCDNNEAAKAVYSSIQRGDLTGMSFIFTVRGENWEGLDTDNPTRHITDIDKVYEVSAVNFPAYDGTDISARARTYLDSAKSDFEDAKYKEEVNNLLIKTI